VTILPDRPSGLDPDPAGTGDNLWIVGDPGDMAEDGPGDQHANGRSPAGRGARSAPKQHGPRSLTRGVIRNVDAWSVLKVSVVFYVAVYCMLLVAAVLLWMAATATGLRGNVEKVVADLIASGKFHFVGSELLRAGVVGGAVLVVAGTTTNVMLAVLYNLITDLVGGVSILVEESPGAPPARRPSPDPSDGTSPQSRAGTPFGHGAGEGPDPRGRAPFPATALAHIGSAARRAALGCRTGHRRERRGPRALTGGRI